MAVTTNTSVHSRSPLLLLALLASLLLQVTQARRWEDVIAVSIYAQSHVDIPRLQFAIEDDPLNVAPTTMLLFESQPPSDAPSQVPSYYNHEDDEADPPRQTPNLECSNGEAAYKVNKYDTWGDGWGDTTISIRQIDRLDGAATVAITEDVTLEDYSPATARSSNPRTNWENRELEDFVLIGGLKNGDFDSQHVCLSQTACYEVTLQGGKWQEEAKWEIVPVELEEGISEASQAVAKGRGFSNCTFHIAEDFTSQPNCPFTCRPKPAPEKEEADEEAEEEGDKLAEAQLAPQAETEPDIEAEPDVEDEAVAKIIDVQDEEEDATTSANGNNMTGRAASTPTLMAPSSAPSDAPSLVPTRTL